MFRPSASLHAPKAITSLQKLGSFRLWRSVEVSLSHWRTLAISRLVRCEEGTDHVALRDFASTSTMQDFVVSNLGNLHGGSCWRLSSRSFASRGARDVRLHDGGLLVNERLVAALCKNRSSPESVEVRVVTKVGGETTSQVTSLSHAIQLSVRHGKDLIGIALDHEVPVVKVDSIQRLSHEAKKSQSKSRLGSLAEKEVRFRTGIAENDFLRKVERVVQYLDKGHNCMLTVTANSNSREPGAARNMATAILERARNGELTHELQASGDQRSVQFRLRPLGSHRNNE